MKKLISTLAVVAASYSMSAHARTLFTECQLNYSVDQAAFGLEVGLGGKGVAQCRDIAGNRIDVPVNVQMVGAGLELGACEATGTIYATGVGFALGDLLGAIGKVDVGIVNHGGRAGGIGVQANPLGLNAEIAFSGTRYRGKCFGLADANALLITQDLR